MKLTLLSTLFFISFYSQACTIGISDEVVSVRPKIIKYINNLIIPVYKRAGLECILNILPSKRLLTYEDKGKIDVIILRIHTDNLDKHYKRFKLPVTYAKRAFYIGKENPQHIGVVRGSAYQEFLVKKHSPNIHKSYANHTRSIYKMYQAKRIDGFFVLEPYLVEYIDKPNQQKIERKKVDELLYYHFISNRLKAYHDTVFTELKKLDPDNELNFEAYIEQN